MINNFRKKLILQAHHSIAASNTKLGQRQYIQLTVVEETQ